MNIIDQITTRIIKQQELIVGPIAWQEAEKVQGLKVQGHESATITESNNPKSVIDNLIGQYEHLFGRASREVCKEAAAGLVADLNPSDVPQSLK